MFGGNANKVVSKNKIKGNGNVNIQNSNIRINNGMDEVLELAKSGDNVGALKKWEYFKDVLVQCIHYTLILDTA